MSPEAQRIAIAKVCGWPSYRNGMGWIATREAEIHGLDGVFDYTHNLNAMHEAEKELTPSQLWKYYILLGDVGYGGNNHWKRFHATAAQRAEAFLRAIGKWKE